MLVRLLKSNISYLNLGSYDHALLLRTMGGACRTAFERDNHTCHTCGFHIPNGMEVDHLNGHKVCGPEDIASICTFCHDLKHPLWAGARHRIVPIWAPDIDQVDLTRLCWSIMTLLQKAQEEEDVAVNPSLMLEALGDRRFAFKQIFKCETAESIFEALYLVRDNFGEEAAFHVATRLDYGLRFFPSFLIASDDTTRYDIGSSLSRWDVGGFKDASEQVSEILSSVEMDFNEVIRIFDKISSEERQKDLS